MFRFNWRYFALAIILFVIEYLIAVFLHDRIIRPYVGDVLVVIFIYCVVRSFIEAATIPIAMSVLIFAFLIESLQYIHLVDLLGLQHNTIARIVIGTSFSWGDILAYVLGIAIVLLSEKLFGKV